MGRKEGAPVPLLRGAAWDLVQYHVAWAEVYFRTKLRLHPSSRLATIDMGRKLGAVPLLGGAGSPSNINVAWAILVNVGSRGVTGAALLFGMHVATDWIKTNGMMHAAAPGKAR